MATKKTEDLDVSFDEGLVLDLSGIEQDKPREALRPSTYDVEIVDVEFTESAAGNPMVHWTLQTLDDEARRLHFRTVLNNPTGKRILRNTIQRVDPEFDLSQIKPMELDEHFIGRHARARVTSRMHEGRRVNDVKAILPPKAEGDFLSQ